MKSTKDMSTIESNRPALPPARANEAHAAVLPVDMDAGFLLDAKLARQIGETHAATYAFAEPFPHIVLDNFLPENITRMALNEFPPRPLPSDRVFEMGYAGLHKRQVLPEECTPPARRMFHFFNSAPFLQFLEGLSSIQGLIPDAYFNGGGFHEISRGGLLGVHADFRINEALHLQRRMNVIVYLNDDWKPEFGGNLELWDRKMQNKCAEIAPIFNRCVVFNTDADTYHGHPDPLTCPEGVFRRSMALYYYTASKEIYNETPNNSTIYQARPGDAAATHREAFGLRFEQHVRQWVPPALQRYVFGLKRRLTR